MNKTRFLTYFSVLFVVLTALLFRHFSRDSLLKASNRFGSALIKSDKSTVWSFIGDDERRLYNFDEIKFSKFWDQIVAPRLQTINQYKIDDSTEGGLFISIYGDESKKSMRFMVSGNDQKYYSPYCISSLCYGCAMSEAKFKIPQEFSINQYSYLASWYKTNKGMLREVGIDGLKTGVGKDYRSIDQLIQAYEAVSPP